MGRRVAHATFGEGLAVRYEGEKITVLFDGPGYQTLALPTVMQNGLLKSASPDQRDRRTSAVHKDLQGRASLYEQNRPDEDQAP